MPAIPTKKLFDANGAWVTVNAEDEQQIQTWNAKGYKFDSAPEPKPPAPPVEIAVEEVADGAGRRRRKRISAT